MEANKEWLKDLPYERIEDLAIYAKMYVAPDASIRITSSLLSEIHMTKEEVLKEAKKNTAKNMVFKSLEEILFKRCR